MQTPSFSLRAHAPALAAAFFFVAPSAPAFVTTSPLGLSDAVTSIVRGGGPRLGTVGLYVVDGVTSRVLVDINAARPMTPASNNKLRTTAAGLSLLGPAFRFKTELHARGPVRDGRLDGDLIVKGGGDPSISGRFEKDKRDVTRVFREWAAALKAAGIREVTGAILLDDSYYDRDYFHRGWYPDERGEWYEAEIWGLSYNDGCVDISWSGKGKMPGDKAEMTLNPKTGYARVDNQVRVVAAGRSSSRYYVRADKSNDIVASGTITVDTSKDDSASVWNGPQYFAAVFTDELTSNGVRVAKPPRLLEPAEIRDAYRGARLIKRTLSPPLTEIVAVINRVSQNFYADSLLKAIGREKRGEGSYAAGIAEAEAFFRAKGLQKTGAVLTDGSGLAEANKVSPVQLVETVRFMDRGPLRTAWRESLPVGGVRGSLKTRFQQTTESRALAPSIMGKTGLIGGVRSLSGIARNRAGHDLYYSIIVNDFSARGDEIIRFLDQAAVAIAASEEGKATVTGGHSRKSRKK